MEDQSPRKEPESSFRGLYKNVKISVKTLDILIVGGILLMVLLVIYGVANNGYTVTFDSNGGTDVAMLTDMMYGDYIPETMQVPESFTLYAAWEKIE